jgi:hypothetical protein
LSSGLAIRGQTLLGMSDIWDASSRQVESFLELPMAHLLDYHRIRLAEGLDMSPLEPLMALAFIVLTVALVEILTHHWLVEILLYALLGSYAMIALVFVYGAVIDLFHDLKSRLKRRLQANNDQA